MPVYKTGFSRLDHKNPALKKKPGWKEETGWRKKGADWIKNTDLVKFSIKCKYRAIGTYRSGNESHSKFLYNN
jgi:hypothetical protein